MFRPTIEDVKNEIGKYTLDNSSIEITDEQAEKILNRWNQKLPQEFANHIQFHVMEGDILNDLDNED